MHKPKSSPEKHRGWIKGQERTPQNRLSLSDSWRLNGKRQKQRGKGKDSNKVTVRFNPVDMERLTQNAEASQMTLSAYIRSTMLAKSGVATEAKLNIKATNKLPEVIRRWNDIWLIFTRQCIISHI